jgi:integration host factor subunit beta
MVKSELIKRLCDLHPNILHKDMEKTLDIVFSEISKAMKEDKKYEIRGYGVFKTKQRKARIAKNPKTGQKIPVEQKRMPVFKMSKYMKIKLNKEFKN